jgi:hypothetical protein
MTPLRIAVVASIFSSATLSFAANLPRNPNVVVCQPNAAGCIHHNIFGHDYQILNTDSFTIMVFLSNEGRYTRADVSITNLTPNPIHLTPEDFHIQATASGSKIFLYVPPSQVENLATLNRASAGPEINEPDTATPHLKAITIQPNQAVHGRVYFERDQHATPQQVNIVLPIAGTVFKFPDVIKP